MQKKIMFIKKVIGILFFVSSISYPMEELDEVSNCTLYGLEELEHRLEQIIFRALQKTKEQVEEEKRVQREQHEKDFITLIEDPFIAKSEEEALEMLSQLLNDVDPLKPRKSLYEMCVLVPVAYLSYQLGIATENQKPRIQKMINMIKNNSTKYLYSHNPV